MVTFCGAALVLLVVCPDAGRVGGLGLGGCCVAVEVGDVPDPVLGVGSGYCTAVALSGEKERKRKKEFLNSNIRNILAIQHGIIKEQRK